MSTENKVRVTSDVGAGSWQGLMDAKVGLVSHKGTITALDSGNYQVMVSGTNVSTQQKFYPHELFVDIDHASGIHAFPTGDGSVLFGHNGIFPNGPLTGSNNKIFASNGSNTVIETTR